MTTTNASTLSNVWAIHSDSDGKPAMRGWARGESDAKKKMDDIRNNDAVKDSRYWVSRLEQNQLEALKSSGLVPKDA